MRLPFGVKTFYAFSNPVHLLNAITSQMAQIGGNCRQNEKEKGAHSRTGWASKISDGIQSNVYFIVPGRKRLI
jgi:hypothetical protein